MSAQGLDSTIVDIQSLLAWVGMSAFAPSLSPSPSSPVLSAPLGTVASTGLASAAAPTTTPAIAPVAPVIASVSQPPQTTVFGSFLKVTGLLPSAHYHVLANVSEKNFEKVMDRWQINGTDADMAQIGMATWAWHKSRQLCHLEPTPSPNSFLPSAALPAAQSTGLQLTASGFGPNVPTIKVAAVLDQRISEEITFLPNSELQKMRARYVDAFDEAPQANVACSNDQLAALNHVLLTGREPYADLAVWAPHGTRILKKSSLSGLNLMRDGTFQQVELFGPPNVEQWCANYDVLSTGCIMLGAVRRPNLAAYKRWICKLSACYGPSVWHLLYQTDVRCRQELMQAVFQELLAAHSAAVMAKTHTDFDPTRPWDAVWKRVLEMKDWWTDEFERPAGLIVTHVKGLNYGLGGDVQIAGQRTTPFQPPQSNNANNGDNGGKGVRKNNNKNKNKGPRNQGHQNGAAPTNIAKGGKGGKGNGAPASAAAASTLWCKICKSTEHDHLQCPQFVQNYSGGKNRKGKGTKGSK